MFRQLVRIGQGLNKLDVQTNCRQLWLGSKDQITKQCSSEVIEDLPDAIKSFLVRENINHQPPGHKKTLTQLALKGKMTRLWSTRTPRTTGPTVIRILKDLETCEHSNDRPMKYLILVSTREQAQQMADVFKGLKSLGIESIVLDGRGPDNWSGMSFKDYDVYIATPDGLMQLIQAHEADLSNIKYLIFDGAIGIPGFKLKSRIITNALARISSKQEALVLSAAFR